MSQSPRRAHPAGVGFNYFELGQTAVALMRSSSLCPQILLTRMLSTCRGPQIYMRLNDYPQAEDVFATLCRCAQTTPNTCTTTMAG